MRILNFCHVDQMYKVPRGDLRQLWLLSHEVSFIHIVYGMAYGGRIWKKQVKWDKVGKPLYETICFQFRGNRLNT